MLENLEKMSKEEAQERLKELNREIRKHEVVFILFVLIGITNIILTILGLISFGFLPVLTVIGCALACYGIYRFSETFEIERSLIKLIFILTDEK